MNGSAWVVHRYIYNNNNGLGYAEEAEAARTTGYAWRSLPIKPIGVEYRAVFYNAKNLQCQRFKNCYKVNITHWIN